MSLSSERTYGVFYADDGMAGRRLPDNTAFLAENGIVRADSPEARQFGDALRQRIADGQTVPLLGFLATAHDSGLSLIEASRADGLSIVAHLEEERFSGVKRHTGYPSGCVAEMKRLLARRGWSPADVFGVFYPYDTVDEEQAGLRMSLVSGAVVRGRRFEDWDRRALAAEGGQAAAGPSSTAPKRHGFFAHSPAAVDARRRLLDDLGLGEATPFVQMLHHECHAYAAYGASPFARAGAGDKPTMIACVDGGGDVASFSLFLAQGHEISLVRRGARVDSIANFFAICASHLGGWTALSADADPRSENRFQGVATYGNQDRLTNPYYRRLAEYFHFGAAGEVCLNKSMAEADLAGLESVVGPFFSVDRNFWTVKPGDPQLEMTRKRADVAAAVQLVFEDALCHIVGDLISRTGADQLVLCGGGALNGVANLRLVEHFGRRYYAGEGRDTRLQLWTPFFASDQGAVLGAPYQFAWKSGARPSQRPASPFIGGLPPDGPEIEAALRGAGWAAFAPIAASGAAPAVVAERLAELVAGGAIVGLFCGAAEIGGRALGGRSILAAPGLDGVKARLNSEVKLREATRPLFGMVTEAAASQLFELEEGAAASDYEAYGYMLLAARARPEAGRIAPALVGADGTCRLQIVQPQSHPLAHAYLVALGRKTGAQASIGTSLNVGTPIVQTAEQALSVLQRSPGLDGLVLVADDGAAWLAWSNDRTPLISAR